MSSAPRPRLTTPRLQLRPVELGDVDRFVAQWNDPDVGRYLWDGQPVARATVVEVIEESRASFAAAGLGLWAVCDPGGELLGFAGLRPASWTANEVELLYALAPAVWGHGLATEAAQAVLRHGLEVAHLHRIVAAANPANPASVRVLERAGMRRTGGGRTPAEELWLFVLEARPVSL